jgi:hypothetical protein
MRLTIGPTEGDVIIPSGLAKIYYNAQYIINISVLKMISKDLWYYRQTVIWKT